MRDLEFVWSCRSGWVSADSDRLIEPLGDDLPKTKRAKFRFVVASHDFAAPLNVC